MPAVYKTRCRRLKTSDPMSRPHVPEKAKLIQRLKRGGFNVPDFIYLSAADFDTRSFTALETFLNRHRESFKVIVRSAHPAEDRFKGGTFDSLETYADLAGIIYARNRIIHSGKTSKRLSILRQQKFQNAPTIRLKDMGVIVMPFIDGTGVMAKMLGDHWEFGYCNTRHREDHGIPFITKTPKDKNLLHLSNFIQNFLGFRCEIEYITLSDGTIYVVQAKDISRFDVLEQKESERSIKLDGIRRIRRRRNYRERPVYVMDTRTFYLRIITACRELAHTGQGYAAAVDSVTELINAYEKELRSFALRHQRFAVLGLSIQSPDKLNRLAHTYFSDRPEFQRPLSTALNQNQYQVDYFLSQADTLIAKDRIRINLGSHDAYGIDTVRVPIWSIYWHAKRHHQVVRKLRRIGFKTGDIAGIEIDAEAKPIVYRL